MKLLVLNGPNLNLLGSREPDVYGLQSIAELEKSCRQTASECGVEVDFRQNNSETELVEWLHGAFTNKLHVVLNPAAFTHYSYALRDACAAVTSSGLSYRGIWVFFIPPGNKAASRTLNFLRFSKEIHGNV